MKVIAHRGASKEAPENTIAAFEIALSLGAHLLECDVHFTKDEQVVVTHDHIPPFDTKGRRISEMELEEIQKLDAGRWFSSKFSFQKIPLLSDVVKLAGSTPIMIEMKKGEKRDKAFTQAVVKEAKGHYIASFDPNYINYILDQTKQGVVVAHSMKEASYTFPVMPKNIALSYEGTYEDIVSMYHESGIEVWTWTVDSIPELAECVNAQVDGVITNDPRLILEQL